MTGMICDGIAASEAIDSSGEILDVAGCDISDLVEGRGTINWEHRGDDAEGASANDIVGRIIFAKKVFSAEDCSDARQLEYYQQLKLPMIYIIYRLFDGSGHPGATALAAIIRDCKKNGEKNLIGLSIEGTTLKKDKNNRLLESVARRVAATIKPCNKSALSNVVSDPNGDNEVEKKEGRFSHPSFTRLTDSVTVDLSPIVESDEIRKAIEAGSYNAAPSALVGGSALQVEDKSLKNRVKAAVRDWDKKTPFKEFLKHRLPEASDEFLDRFTDMVQDFTIRKAQKDVIRAVAKKKIVEKVQAKAKADQKPKLAVVPPVPVPPADALTIRGRPIFPNPEGTKVAFDEKTGVLHTPRGSFPMYIPSRDREYPDASQTLHNILQDPKVGKFHDYAMKNWVKLHERLKAGTLPPEVVMHGVLFSQMSPNTPVPMQEMMYAHMVDAMRHTGIDPRTRDPKRLDILRHDWLNRDHPQKWPEHSREHFERLEHILRNDTDSELTGRKAGEIGGFQLGPNKFKNISKYGTLHDSLVELVNRHKGDARGGIAELMFHKKQAGLWAAKRRRDLDKGYADPGPYTGGPDVPGLATKTGRYTYGMLGGGNIVVPDTHFTRYLFGLDRTKDADTIHYLKGRLWDEGNSHVMGAIDRYYAKHHDAVKHMLAHPTWGKYFQNPEDAIFPAFWKNWVAILPHEAARGMKNFGWNESTDHRPYWDAVRPYLNKSEVDANLAQRTAKTHHQWVEQYGEMPALLMYYHYLVPQLLAPAERREQTATVQKFEALAIDLRKAADGGVQPAAKPARPQTVKFNGKTVNPGKAYSFDDDQEDMAILDHHPDFYTAVPESKIHGWETKDLIKLPRRGTTLGYQLVTPPTHLEAPSIVSHEVHTIPEFTHHQETKDLVHGLDLEGPKTAATLGVNKTKSFWTKNAQGKRVYVKSDDATMPWRAEFGNGQREALFHNLARDFYGLGQYVSPTTVVTHPTTGTHMTVVEHAPGEHRDPNALFDDRMRHKVHLKKLWDSGELQKIAMMDTINHNTDRHEFNYLLTPDGGMKLIDHGLAFTDKPMAPFNSPNYLLYMGADPYKEPVHPEAAKWLAGLQPDELELQMRRHRVPESIINETSRRLRSMQRHLRVAKGGTFDDALFAPFSLR